MWRGRNDAVVGRECAQNAHHLRRAAVQTRALAVRMDAYAPGTAVRAATDTPPQLSNTSITTSASR